MTRAPNCQGSSVDGDEPGPQETVISAMLVLNRTSSSTPLKYFYSHFFAFFLNCSQLFSGGGIAPWPHPWRLLGEIRDGFKGKTFFLEITTFLREKIDKTGTD